MFVCSVPHCTHVQCVACSEEWYSLWSRGEMLINTSLLKAGISFRCRQRFRASANYVASLPQGLSYRSIVFRHPKDFFAFRHIICWPSEMLPDDPQQAVFFFRVRFAETVLSGMRGEETGGRGRVQIFLSHAAHVHPALHVQ